MTDVAILYPSTTVKSCLTPTVSAADVFDAVEHPRGDFAVAHSAGSKNAGANSDGMLRELLGRMSWRSPEEGILGAAGISSTLVDEDSLASDVGTGGSLFVGGDEHRTLIVPDISALRSTSAERLLGFVRAGGNLVVLGSSVEIVGGLLDDTTAVRELADLIAAGHARIRRYESVAAFADQLDSIPRQVDADVSTMLRWSPDGSLRLLVPAAANQASVPMPGSTDLLEGFTLDRSLYAKSRVISVEGEFNVWLRDPVNGEAARIPSVSAGGRTSFQVTFDAAPIAILELVPMIESSTPFSSPGASRSSVELPADGWLLRAVPIVEDYWNDLGSDSDQLTVRALRYEAKDADGSWVSRRSGFAITGLTRPSAADAEQLPLTSSPSRGPGPEAGAHVPRFATGGVVPESFWSLGTVAAGEAVEAIANFIIEGSSTYGRYVLRIGARAVTTAWIDDAERISKSNAYYSTVEVALEPGIHSFRMLLESEREQALDVSWAVLPVENDIERPQWVAANSGETASFEFSVDRPETGELLFGCLGKATLRLNGAVVSRSGEFHNYEAYGFPSVHNHDIGSMLVVGRNILEVTFTSVGTVVLIDAVVGDQRIMSGPRWTGATETPYMPYDPTVLRIAPLPSVLPQAADAAPGLATIVPFADAPRWRVQVPPGCRLIIVDGAKVREFDSPPPAGEWQEFDGEHPHSAVEFELDAGPGTLSPMDELGLADFAGAVDYSLAFDAPSELGRCVELDLGDVRGTAGVWLNGVELGARLWAPWRFDCVLEPNNNELRVRVTNTLAGHFTSINPRSMTMPGEERAGLFGPVRITGPAPESQEHNK